MKGEKTTMISIKKVMAGVLVAAMALSFTACSNSKTKTESEASAISKPLTSASPKTSSSPKATATPKATAKPTETPKATQTPAPTQTPQATQAPTATPAPTEVPQQTTESGFSEQDARNILAMPCHVLNGFDDETYNVSYDTSVTYLGLYYSQEDADSGATPYGLMDESQITDDMNLITGVNPYFLVTDAVSNDDVRSQLLAYVSQDVLDQLYGEPTFDCGDNQTYLRRGGRGYYQIDRDFNNATITDLTDTSFTATMDCYEWDQYQGTCTIYMSKIDGGWDIVGYSQNF